MKKLPFKIYLIAVLLFVFSCQNDDDYLIDSIEKSFTIEDARNWNDANNPPIIIMSPPESTTVNDKLKSKPKKPILIQSDWKHAFTSKKGHLEVVELALKSLGRIGHASKESMEKWKETKNRGYLTPLSRLVIIKNKKDKSINSYIMTIVGETSYLESKNFKLWKNTYLKKDKDFAGIIYFHTVSGEFVNGWQLKKGKVTGKITSTVLGSVQTNDTNSKLKSSSNCNTYYGVTTYEQCTGWYSVGETEDEYFEYYSSTTCETWDEVTDTFTICESDNDDPYAEGGSVFHPNVYGENVSFPYPHCSSFEYAKPPGALVTACAVENIQIQFYAYGEQNGVNGTFEIIIDYPLVYFSMPLWRTNGNSATLTATAVNNAFNETQSWFENYPYATEGDVGDFLDNRINIQMGMFNGSMSGVAPFSIPNPAPYVTSLYNTGNCN